MKFATKLVFFLAALTANSQISAEPYVIMDRLQPSKPTVLGISGLYPQGCHSGFVGCSNIAFSGIVLRVGYVDREDFPNLVVVKDVKTGTTHSIDFPYEEIWNSIGTADSSWIGRWLKPGSRITIVGVIGGSQANISIDSIYKTDFLLGQPTKSPRVSRRPK